jgi:LPXTG-motif cell wall-anchored protein
MFFRKALILGVFVVVALVVASVGGTPVAASGPASYEAAWTQAMNQTSYWSPWICTKYENHSGHIAAQYDAAIIKDGTRVRVYSDLTNVGAFTAQGATNPANGKLFPAPHSWVMKCTFPTPPTTVPPTTEPPTTLPPETTTPETTEPPTTEPPTTEPPTTDPPIVETSAPPVPSEPTEPPTTPTPDGEPSTPTLPSTGGETWIAILAAAFLASGLGITGLARRR